MAKIDAFFRLMHENKASDLHLVSGQQPAIRIRGEIERIKYDTLNNESLKVLLYEITPEHKIKQFEETGDVDFAYEIPGLARYRANYFQQKYGIAAVFREIPSQIATCQELGMPNVIAKLALLPRGLVLVTGPTGSGKTTSLYAALSEIHSEEEKIITIEDPVEYQLKGIVQIPVNEKKGLTFARGLRSILRHDPDKIMVGEIRDSETAQIAVQSALTGHLVFTTVHANNVFDVLGRFLHMGIDPYNFVSCLNCVVAQRLVRKICPHCKHEVRYDRQTLEESGLNADQYLDHPFYEGSGCKECNGMGYQGRSAIVELLELNDEIRELLVNKVPVSQLKKAAVASGTRFLRESAVEKVLLGISTLKEINRVTFVEKVESA